jgi:thioredoxin reductase (NADPH)
MAARSPTLRDTDCVIIGGGPSGLAAALCLARFRRSVVVIDHGNSRAQLIPKIRNLPGFPDGIAGRELLQSLHTQLNAYGVVIHPLSAVGLEKDRPGFRIRTLAGDFRARSVILATGSRDVRPDIADHDEAVSEGLLRYCPVCDGYEVAGQRVGLMALESQAAGKLTFLQSLTDEVDLRTFKPGEVALLERRGRGVALVGDAAEWDTVYAALGSRPQTELGVSLNARLGEGNGIAVDVHQQTSVPGLYAIGDVVAGLDQIAVGLGQASQTACHIHAALLR